MPSASRLLEGHVLEMVSIDQFESMANRLFDEIPPPLLEGLNGGIIIQEEACQEDPDLPDVYVLGHYVEDPFGLGCYIVLYYGSFAAILGDEPPEVWEDELWETMIHEVQHHVEARAGESNLDIQDMIELERLRRESAGQQET